MNLGVSSGHVWLWLCACVGACGCTWVPVSPGSQRTTLGIVLQEHPSYIILFLSQSFSLAWNFPVRPGWPNSEPQAHSCLPLLYRGGTRLHHHPMVFMGVLEVTLKFLHRESSVLSPFPRCPQDSVPRLPNESLLVFISTRAEYSREKRSHPPLISHPKFFQSSALADLGG